MRTSSEQIIYRLDAVVEQLEDEGYPFLEIMDAMAEFIEIAMDYE